MEIYQKFMQHEKGLFTDGMAVFPPGVHEAMQ